MPLSPVKGDAGVGSGFSDSLAGLGDALIGAVTSESFLTFAKNIGVGVMAVAGGALICGATAGAGCIVIASAAVGAAANVVSGEALDCAYRECGEFSLAELSGDVVQGVVIGASSGYLNTQLSGALGADTPAIGLLSASWNYGVSATGAALLDQSRERAALAFVKYLVEQSVGG